MSTQMSTQRKTYEEFNAQRKTYEEFNALIDDRLSELNDDVPSISVLDIDGTVFLPTLGRLVSTINPEVIGVCNKLRRGPRDYILFLTARQEPPATTLKTFRANGVLEQLGFDDNDLTITDFESCGCAAVESPSSTSPILVVTMVGLREHVPRSLRERAVGRFKRLVISQLSNVHRHLQPVVAVGDREHDVGLCSGDLAGFDTTEPLTVSRLGFIGYVVADVNKGHALPHGSLPAQACRRVDGHASTAVACVLSYIVGRSRGAPSHSTT